jgi:hypothetical protein
VRLVRLLCAVLRRGIAIVLVMKDQAEVCALSRGMISALHNLNPYPPHYRPAFAFSAFLYPHPLQLSSRSACPLWAGLRAYRVPHEQLEGSGPASPPRELMSVRRDHGREATALYAFWLKPTSVAKRLVYVMTAFTAVHFR